MKEGTLQAPEHTSDQRPAKAGRSRRSTSRPATLAEVAQKPAFVVLNGVRPNSNVGLEAEAGLTGQGAQVAPVMLKQRVQFEYAVQDGRTVQEAYPTETAAGCLTNGLPDQCLHPAEADVRPPRRKPGFDPEPT